MGSLETLLLIIYDHHIHNFIKARLKISIIRTAILIRKVI